MGIFRFSGIMFPGRQGVDVVAGGIKMLHGFLSGAAATVAGLPGRSGSAFCRRCDYSAQSECFTVEPTRRAKHPELSA